MPTVKSSNENINLPSKWAFFSLSTVGINGQIKCATEYTKHTGMKVTNKHAYIRKMQPLISKRTRHNQN